MYGAIIGDIIGSRFEFIPSPQPILEFFHAACAFTDDTVLTAATSAATQFIVQYNEDTSVNSDAENPQETIFAQKVYAKVYRQYTVANPMAGYGKSFYDWAHNPDMPAYNSKGNGCLMRVSPIIFYAKDHEDAQKLAYDSAVVSHNDPDAIQSVKNYIDILYYALTFTGEVAQYKQWLQQYVKDNNINIQTVEQYQKSGGMHVFATDTLERAIACVLEGEDFAHIIHNVLSIGGDTDTNGAVAGAIAEILYGMEDMYYDSILKYFNFKNVSILKSVANNYENLFNNSSHIGSLAQKNLLNNVVRRFTTRVENLVMTDPTAQFDPLEDLTEDEYYSDIDKKLMLEQRSLIVRLFKKAFPT